MDFEKIIATLQTALQEIFENKYKGFTKESKKDINAFLQDSKEKLKRWTLLLEEEKLTLDDFEWLLKSQKDLLHVRALKTAGISAISLGHFKNKVIRTVLKVVKGFVFA